MSKQDEKFTMEAEVIDARPNAMFLVRLPNDEVFVFAGGVPPFGFLRAIGVRFGGAEKAVA